MNRTRIIIAALGLAIVSITVAALVTRTPAPPTPMKSAAATNTPSQNYSIPSWGNGRTMCLDPAASTSCSGGGSVSDNNDCSCTCNALGIGPCQTWAGGFVNRWYGLTPRFNLNTQVNLVSSQSQAQLIQDPIVITPRLEGIPFDGGPSATATFAFVGTPTTTTTTTIASHTAKNRDAHQALLVTLTAGNLVNALYQNTTHPSTAYSWHAQGGGELMTQPLLWAAGLFQTGPLSSEVDTWTDGDSINVLSLPSANVVIASPYVDQEGTQETAMVILQDVHVTTGVPLNNSAGDQQMFVGPYVVMVDDFIDQEVIVSGSSAISHRQACGSSNVYYNGGFTGGLRGGSSRNTGSGGVFLMLGGFVTTGVLADTTVFNGVWLDGDIVLNLNALSSGSGSFQGTNYAGLVENNWTSRVEQGALILQSPLFFTDAGSPDPCPPQGCDVWWYHGAGVGATKTLDTGRGTIFYPAGADGGASTFPSAFVTKVAGAAVGCTAIQGTGTMTCGQAAATGANLDTQLGPDAGCVTNGGPSGFCNTPL